LDLQPPDYVTGIAVHNTLGFNFNIMRDSRFKFGLLVTVAWLAIAAFILLRDPAAASKMTPNDWGSFLSGSFAPLAFLWLVLGYLQQGEELKLSTHALQLQAAELKNSVEQQRDLVEVTRTQVASERETLEYERKLREELSSPRIVLTGAGGSFRGDGESQYSFKVTNTGHAATAVTGELIAPDLHTVRVIDFPIVDKGDQYLAVYTHPGPLQGAETRLFLRYTDGLGIPRRVVYAVQREDDSLHASLRFVAVEA
jgi:hypothetical protein